MTDAAGPFLLEDQLTGEERMVRDAARASEAQRRRYPPKLGWAN